MGYSVVSLRHLEGLQNPDGLNLGLHTFVEVYKVHMYMYMLGGVMRSWTTAFSFSIFLLSEKEKQKIWTQTTDNQKSKI